MGIVLLVVAGVAYVKLSAPDKPAVSAPQVTQKASELPDDTPQSVNETQLVGLTFNLLDRGVPYIVRVDKLEYANLAETTQVTTVTVSGSIEDFGHPVKFWQKPARFQLLDDTGRAFAAKPVIRGTKGKLTYNIVYSAVPVQALRGKKVNLLIEPAPVLVDNVLVPGEPIVVGVTPDRFRRL
jgi:hypothetical protein